jgi:C-terminal processing protease CtpA/Prc
MTRILNLLSLSFLILIFGVISAVGQEPPRQLVLDSPVERDLPGSQIHAYTIRLTASQIARVIVEQRDTDVVVSAIAPDGVKLIEVDSPNGPTGRAAEEICTIAGRQDGLYRIEIRPAEKNARTGRYVIRLSKFLSELEYLTERLAAVGRLWGTIKYFHPYLAYRDIDWDGALVRAIPQIKAARTPNEYRQVIGNLLQTLNDPATSIIPTSIESHPASASSTSKAPTYYRVVDEHLIIYAADWARARVNRDVTAPARQQQMMAEIAKARGIVLDCRMRGIPAAEAPSYLLSFYLDSLLPHLVQSKILFGTERYRTHNGYAPQRGSTSGGYTAAFVTQVPGTVVGQATSRKPLAMVLDEKTPDLVPLLSGLQASGVKIIQVGKGSREASGRTHQVMLADGVKVRIRTTEFVHPNGGSIFEANEQLPRDSEDERVISAALAAVTDSASEQAATTAVSLSAPMMHSSKEATYPQMSFPSEEYRLLALFRFWNVINRFFPYKHLTDKPWDTVLTDFIPRFLENKNQLDYEMTIAEMVAHLQDTHGFVGPLKSLDAHLGEFAPPIALRVASGKLTIARLLDENVALAAGVQVGDSIIAVDGVPIEQRIEYLSKFKSLSNSASAYRFIHPTALRGLRDSTAKLRIEGSDGQIREVEMRRTAGLGSILSPLLRKTPVYQVLPNGYGYIDLARLPLADAHKSVDAVMQTPGMIFDMRGYPNGVAWEIGPRLSQKRNFTVAQFRRPLYAATDFDDEDLEGSAPDYFFAQKMPAAKGAIYKGRVVVLINEDAISQSEHTCLFFEAATNVTFIGSETDGANGDVTNLVLPGAIYVAFSGHDVRHADGRQLQRVGIQPDLRVEPTPKGLRDGRDEVFEAAVKYLDSTVKN